MTQAGPQPVLVGIGLGGITNAGASLERFPRNLTAVSGAHGDPTAEHEWCPECEPTEGAQ